MRFCLFFGLLLLGACTRKAKPEPGVVAVVDGNKILDEEVQDGIRQYREGMKLFSSSGIPDHKVGELRSYVIDQLVNARVVLQEAKRQKLSVSDPEVDAYLARLKQNPRYDDILKMRNLDETALREKLRDEMVLMKFMESSADAGETDASEEEIRTFYEEHKENFQQPTRVRARHILIKAGKSQTQKDRARKKIEDIAQKVAAGQDFAQLAKKYSEDPNTQKKGGDLGYFGKGDLLPQFDQAAMLLKKGQVSPPVSTDLGYHLIQIVDKKDEKVPPLKEIKDQVAKLVVMQKKTEDFEKLVAKLRKKANVTIF